MSNSTEVYDAIKAVEKSHKNINGFQAKLEGQLLSGIGELFAFVGKVYKVTVLIYQRQNALEAKLLEIEQNNLRK